MLFIGRPSSLVFMVFTVFVLRIWLLYFTIILVYVYCSRVIYLILNCKSTLDINQIKKRLNIDKHFISSLAFFLKLPTEISSCP